MNLASVAESLRAGRSRVFVAKGNSMTPLVLDGEKVKVVPIWRPLKVDDVVLAKVRGRYYLHKVTAIEGNRYQIGNNKGRINGWASEVLGVLG